MRKATRHRISTGRQRPGRVSIAMMLPVAGAALLGWNAHRLPYLDRLEGALPSALVVPDDGVAMLVANADSGPMVATRSGDVERARFGVCHMGGGTNCVVDGDTFWYQGEKIRVADIDAPETHPPRCAAEAVLGARATSRLQVLLNDGPFTLVVEDRDTDRYGRKLRVVERDGQSLGAMLVDEGLARSWTGHRDPWCPETGFE